MSVSAIARQVGLDRKTVHKYIERGLRPPVYGPRPPRASKIAPFSHYLHERLAAFPQPAGRRLHRELRDLGYATRSATSPIFLRDIRRIETAPFEVRFEMPPGRQAQVDFAHCLSSKASVIAPPRRKAPSARTLTASCGHGSELSGWGGDGWR